MEDLAYQGLIHGNSVIAWVAAAVLGLIGKYIVSKIENENVRKYVGRALDEVADAVAEVYQTFVNELKAGNADGKLTAEEKVVARKMAIDTAKSNIGTKGLKRLAKVAGIDALDEWLGTKVEATVKMAKAAESKEAVSGSGTPGPLS